MSEAAFLRMVTQLALHCGWLVYHTHDSRRSFAGFPDLALVHPRRGRALFAELKVGRRKATAEQLTWLAAMGAAGLDARLWRHPESWPDIERTLKGEA